MFSDLRFAFRQITKAPAFTTIIVVTLALAIGACTAIYSALDSIVLHPYDDPETERNVVLQNMPLSQRASGAGSRGLSFPDFLDLEKQATSFEFLAQFYHGQSTVTGSSEPLQLRRILCTPRYFDLFGIKMILGRPFLPVEFRSGEDNAIVLSYACWQRAFGGASDIIGRTFQVDNKPRTVVGVMSERFERSAGFIDIWLPHPVDLPLEPNTRNLRDARGAVTTARLRKGVTIEQAQSELDVIAAALAAKDPATNTGLSIRAIAGLPSLQSMVSIIQILFCAVGCLMLIACANVASLLLVRANGRQREMSVRAALGASRGRLLRQLLTENILVALIGGTAGVLLAQWAVDLIRSSVPTVGMNLVSTGAIYGLVRLSHLELNGTVLAFALGLSFTTALVFGLAPAWLSSSADLNEALKQGTRGSTEGRSRGRFRATLVIAEIAMALTLLACSGLLIRSFLKLTDHDPGFDPRHTAFVAVDLKGPDYAKPEQQRGFADALLTRIQNVPGVEAVGTTSYLPLSANRTGPGTGYAIEGGSDMAIAERPLASLIQVSPGYFRTMGIALKHGRFFSDFDDPKAPRVAIINQTLARERFPNQSPLGKRIIIGTGPDMWREIVGVVGDVGQSRAEEVPPAQIYEPYAQRTNPGFFVVVRGQGDPKVLPSIVKTQVQALDPSLPVGDMDTVANFLRAKITVQRLTLHLLTAFAAVGLFIAAIGIYGVIAFSVSQRTAEIGIRMALGAQKQDVLRLVLRQGAWLVGIGFAVGLVATLIAGRALESQLYNTSGSDPVALVGITVFFAAIAALACWLPARRATKVDPIVALRAE